MRMVDLSREIYHRTPAHPAHPPVVMTVWNDHSEIKEAGAPAAAAAANAVTAGKDAAMRAARVPTGGNASRSEGAGAKIYRRSEILELMTNNPAKYDLLADEIALAYQQNRVR